jgi:hypothetical protein
MHASEPTRQEVNARTDRRHRLGIDADGDVHYQDAVLGAIWIVRDGELVHIETDHTVEEWISRIETQCGWDDLEYSTKPTSEWLTDALTEAL